MNSATTRIGMSVSPPAANGTIRVTGCVGQFSVGAAVAATVAAVVGLALGVVAPPHAIASPSATAPAPTSLRSVLRFICIPLHVDRSGGTLPLAAGRSRLTEGHGFGPAKTSRRETAFTTPCVTMGAQIVPARA